MMPTNASGRFSDLPIPPGEVLAEELDSRGMTRSELAAKLECPPRVINDIIRGHQVVTQDIAVRLHKALGIEASFWVNLEIQYQMTLACE